MLKTLSRSVLIMFIYDLCAILFSTYYWYEKLNLDEKFIGFVVLITVLTGIITLFLKDNYKIREFNINPKSGYLLFEGCVFANIPSALLMLFGLKSINSLLFIVINVVCMYILLRLYRILFHYYLFNLKREKNVLIIGANKEAKLIADEIMNKKALKMKVQGFVTDTENGENYLPVPDIKIYSSFNKLNSIIKKNNIDIIIVAIKRRMEEELLSVLIDNIPQKTKVYKMAEFYEKVTGKYYIDKMSTNWLFYDFMKKRSKIYDFLKRAFDIISALIILTVTFPVLLYIGIRVKKIDKGPIIYTQNRVGKGGKIFKAYKLRTMYKNNYKPEEDNLEETNDENDNRVIPFCKWVRKARLDEIPQMINILKGEISIVGPRCEWEKLVNIYSKKIPYYSQREIVKTGWTGWAQINQGHCISKDNIKEKLEYDFYYIKHRNIFWEIGILIKAIFLALGGRHG